MPKTLLEQAEWLLKKPVPVELEEMAGQLMVARGLVDRLAAQLRRQPDSQQTTLLTTSTEPRCVA
jgi:hypothetical protein